MRNVLLCVVLIGLFVAVQGCSNAGPFVTDIGFDGETLVITKNTVVLDPFLGIVKNGNNPTTTKIKIQDRKN